MRIGIDIHAVERDGSGNCTYIRNLTTHLLQMDQQNEYVLFGTQRDHPFYKTLKAPNAKLLFCSGSALHRYTLFLSQMTKQEKLDVLHVQYFCPWRSDAKLVVTIHDLTPLRYPQYFSLQERMMFRLLLPRSARLASIVLTTSKTSAIDLQNILGVDENRIRITPLGIQQLDSAPSSQKRIPYILYVGRIDPRKNLIVLVEAFSILKKRNEIPCKLVIAGKSYFAESRLHHTIERSEFRNDIELAGFIPDSELPSLYHNAAAFVYPSAWEGFGLPPLEAMASGTPVIVCDLPVFRETLADAALIVPDDPEKIADAMHLLLTNEEKRANLIQRGLQRAKEYRWENTARTTLAAYQEVSGG
jgi:glycosyltransferase involved in cell wall biosynthesis